jgi:hypothetical protein
VYKGNSAATAVAAIMRSTALRRGFRPAAMTAAVTLPYARAVSASKGIGSNSCSARCSTSSRRARSAASKYRSCSASDRTSCGPAESSASVTALIAISSGSSSGAIRLRRIMMLVSTRPRCTGSSVIRTAALIGRCILIRPERVRVDHRGAARHGGKLRSRYEPATLAQRHKLANPVTISGHRESLTTLDSIHDFLRPHPQVALGDLRLSTHGIHGSTRCYSVLSRTRAPSPATRGILAAPPVPDVSGVCAGQRRRTGIEPADDASRRPPVLKTDACHPRSSSSWSWKPKRSARHETSTYRPTQHRRFTASIPIKDDAWDALSADEQRSVFWDAWRPRTHIPAMTAGCALALRRDCHGAGGAAGR